MTWENDYKAQANFERVLRARETAWKSIDAGWKLYEPLPQTPEETVLWNQFLKEWDAWKALDARIGKTIDDLSRNTSEDGQKALFVRLFKELDEVAPLYGASKTTLN